MHSFAVIPAAGLSTRMGQPKLLLSWKGATIIEHVLAAWQGSRVTQIVVVVRPNDQQLAAVCRRHGVQVVVPERPPEEMKTSVQRGLEFIQDRFQPQRPDVWLLAPADMPHLSAAVIDRLLTAHDLARPAILVPRSGDGRRGHPVLLPWETARLVPQLAADQGVNALLAQAPVRTIVCDDLSVLDDLDTPEEYARLKEQ